MSEYIQIFKGCLIRLQRVKPSLASFRRKDSLTLEVGSVNSKELLHTRNERILFYTQKIHVAPHVFSDPGKSTTEKRQHRKRRDSTMHEYFLINRIVESVTEEASRRKAVASYNLPALVSIIIGGILYLLVYLTVVALIEVLP